MKEIPVILNEDAALVVCECGGLVYFDPLEVKDLNEKVVQCDVCKTKVLLLSQKRNTGCI